MPLYELECLACGHLDTYLMKHDEPASKEVCKNCEVEGGLQMVMSTISGYSIKGNNSASVTPKKFRGGRR